MSTKGHDSIGFHFLWSNLIVRLLAISLEEMLKYRFNQSIIDCRNQVIYTLQNQTLDINSGMDPRRKSSEGEKKKKKKPWQKKFENLKKLGEKPKI